jgi:hypothetical protein
VAFARVILIGDDIGIAIFEDGSMVKRSIVSDLKVRFRGKESLHGSRGLR